MKELFRRVYAGGQVLLLVEDNGGHHYRAEIFSPDNDGVQRWECERLNNYGKVLGKAAKGIIDPMSHFPDEWMPPRLPPVGSETSFQ